MSKSSLNKTATGNHVAVKGPCNLSCIFCNPFGKAPSRKQSVQQIYKEIDAVKNRGFDEINFGFRQYEPTTHPDLIKAISYASQRGFKRIRMFTNGIYTSEMKYLSELKNAGLTNIGMSFVSHEETTNDLITQSKGSLQQQLRTIQNSMSLGIDIDIQIIAMSINQNELRHIVDMLSGYVKQFARRYITISVFNPAGAGKTQQVLIPHYSSLAEGITLCAKHHQDINFKVLLLPHCMLKEANLMENVETYIAADIDTHTLRKNFVKYDICDKCSQHESCSGVLKSYIAKYGASEFTGDGDMPAFMQPSLEEILESLKTEPIENVFDEKELFEASKHKKKCLSIFKPAIHSLEMMTDWKFKTVEIVSINEVAFMFKDKALDTELIVHVRKKMDGVPEYPIKSNNYTLFCILKGQHNEETKRISEYLLDMFATNDSLLS